MRTKILKADTHEKLAKEIDDFFRDNHLDPEDVITISYSVAPLPTTLFSLIFSTTFHYALIVYRDKS